MPSPYLNLATDGTDLGANLATITALTAVAQSGDRRSVTETRYGGGWFTWNSLQRCQYPSVLLSTDLPSWAALSALPQHSVSGDTALRALLDGTTLTSGGHVVIVDTSVVYTADYFGNWPQRLGGDQVPGGTNVVFLIAKPIWDSMVANSGLATVCPEKKRASYADASSSYMHFKCTNALGQFAVYSTVNGLAVPTYGWRFVGIRFSVDPSIASVSHLVQLGSGDGAVQNKASQLASNLILDRWYADAHAGCDVRHGVEMHCRNFGVLDGMSGNDIHVQNYSESHVLCGYNGPGPGRIVNNYVCGGSQKLFFGGAASPCGTPSDIEVRYNVFTTPTSWTASSPWKMKCGIEAKKWARSIIEGNIIENVYPQSQIGAGLLLKSENYDSVTPTTQDLLVQNNLVRNVAHALTFAGVANGPLAPARRIISYNNLYLVGAPGYYSADNNLIGPYYSEDSGMIHDTVVAEQAMNAIGQPTQGTGGPVRMILRDTIFAGTTSYGLKPDAGAEGTGGLVSVDVTKSVFQGRSSTGYPAGNYFPADLATIAFTNPAAKDYSLSGTTQTGGGTVTPVATSLRIKVQPSGGPSGSVLPTQPVIEVLDQFGNVFNSTATITATSDSGSVSETGASVAAVAGTATFTALTPTAGATVNTTWTFTSPGLTSVTSNDTTVTVPVATRVATALALTTQPAGAVSGVALTQQPVLQVRDQYGDPIAWTGSIVATANSEGAVVSVAAGGTISLAAASSGAYTALTLLTTIAKNASLTFAASGLTSVTSGAFPVAVVVTPAPTPTPDPTPEPPTPPSTDPVPASLVFTREPGPAGKLYSKKKWPQQPIVTAYDLDGNVMTTYNGPMTLYTTSDTVTLRGTLTVTAVGGVGRWIDVGASGSGPMDLNVTDGPHP